MITFRGDRVDGAGMVKGNLMIVDRTALIFSGEMSRRYNYKLERQVYTPLWKEVHPESLAIGDTTLCDKNETVIFGSFEYEEGKMSRGGDVVNYFGDTGRILFTDGCLKALFESDHGEIHRMQRMKLEIIGNAWSNPELLGQK